MGNFSSCKVSLHTCDAWHFSTTKGRPILPSVQLALDMMQGHIMVRTPSSGTPMSDQPNMLRGMMKYSIKYVQPSYHFHHQSCPYGYWISLPISWGQCAHDCCLLTSKRDPIFHKHLLQQLSVIYYRQLTFPSYKRVYAVLNAFFRPNYTLEALRLTSTQGSKSNSLYRPRL